MRYTTLLLCFCSILLLGSCKSQPSAQNGQPLEVMTFNVRLDIPSDSVNNWNYRKGDAGFHFLVVDQYFHFSVH